jgi:hypothetical protein
MYHPGRRVLLDYMTFTDRSDLFGSVDEEALNRTITWFRRRRPSLFTYATPDIAADWREMLCVDPEPAQVVLDHGDPVVTVENQLLPIPGTGGALGLDFAIQITKLVVDLAPQTVALPPELGTLADQHLSLTLEVCVGMPEIDPDLIVKLGRRLADRDQQTTVQTTPQVGMQSSFHPDRAEQPPKDRVDPRPIPFDKLRCCCLTVAATAHVVRTGSGKSTALQIVLDGLEIVDISPDCLETDIEQYLWLTLQLAVLPKLRLAVGVITLELMQGLPSVSFSLTPTDPQLPFNPDISDDRLAVFVDLEVAP